MKKKIEKKTNNIITVNQKESSERSEYDWSKVAQRLKEYSMRPTSINIYRFFLNEDIPESTFNDAVARESCMKVANAFAKIMVGCNREEICVARNLTDSHVTARPLWQFLDMYHLDMKERAKLKQMVADAQRPAVINYYSKPIPEEDEKK